MTISQRNKPSSWQPLLLSVFLIIGILIGIYFSNYFNKTNYSPNARKFGEVLNFIETDYVDTVNSKTLIEHAIAKMLEKLDPHTSYIPKQEIASVHAQLEANFEGVGIEFYIIRDTIYVVATIPNGPSQKAGLLAGDRIIKVDTNNVAGLGITSTDVFNHLRGPKGSKVKVTVLRKSEKSLLEFTIERNKIPTHSLEASYMASDSIGYIKISRFSETTYNEFYASLKLLKESGANQIILDLRDNPGGYMDMATKIADEFLAANLLIVYTIAKDYRFSNKQFATKQGEFEDGSLIVLINQASASASEILAGAIQDNDRGLIIGSRSFGKGLVQRPIELSDGSELRLTISRYYTPCGRSIQKPYNSENIEEYSLELNKRFLHGEYFHADSIKFEDSLKFKTLKGRTVYGGGGIMPDLFIPQDTNNYSNYALQLLNKNIIKEYALDFYSNHKTELSKYTIEDFKKQNFISEKMIKELIAAGIAAGIKFKSHEFKISKNLILNELKAYLAKSTLGNNAYYEILNQNDGVYIRALKSFRMARKINDMPNISKGNDSK
ncbi:MAG: S41 family peptidase [Cytophagales bacterium]|nr:MAG: S41 family peptidase [Cytophagales bacterium]